MKIPSILSRRKGINFAQPAFSRYTLAMTGPRLLSAGFCIVIVFLTLFGCATPPTPSSDAPSAAAPPEGKGKYTVIEDSDNEVDRIVLRSNPSKARVYINGFYRGETPLTIEDPPRGEYSITLEKEGYRSFEAWIRYGGSGTLEYERTLEELTGFVSLDYSPVTADAFLDSQRIFPGLTEMPVGRYYLEVREFGFETESRTIEIREDQATHVGIDLEKAELRIENLRIRPKIFSPADPAALGSADITFWVSSYGSGRVVVRDSAGKSVFVHEIERFTAWDQAVRWDGRDMEGEILEDGAYGVEVTVFSPRGIIEDDAEGRVTLDRSARTRFRSAYSGIAGLLFTPVPEALPPLRTIFTFGVLAHVGERMGSRYSRVPAQLALRISPIKNFETLVQLTVFPQSEESTPFSTGLSVKYLFLHTDHLGFAVGLKGTYLANERLDTLTNFTGGALSVNFSAGSGPFRFLLAPEIQISPYRIVYDTSASYPVLPVYVWSYGRVGVLLDFHALSIGLSGVFRFKPFSEGFQIHWPVAAGIEAYWVIPGSRMGLFGAFSGEYSPLQGFALLAGLGIGVVL